MRSLRQTIPGVFLLVLAGVGCEVEPSAPPAPQAQVQAAPAPPTDRRAESVPRSSAPVVESATANDALRVRKVIDGDTITVSGIGVVRLLGVDAPEKTGGYREAERYGDEATRFMRALVDGKLVRLEYDGDRKDQYDRTLAYVVLDDGTIANEAIIRAGWAETYRRFAFRRKPDFQAAERDARAARRGMWNTRQ